ncbi:MAG: hypothetical protein KAI17_03395 [Thiotrichaceae bacterium]|nr:hypothetical protein [Thiotrichaceae bacterium]
MQPKRMTEEDRWEFYADKNYGDPVLSREARYASPYPYSSEEEQACMEAPYGDRNQC